jgi:chromosome segregation ATPase
MYQANLTLEDRVDSLATCNARAQIEIASYLDQNHQLQAMLETERSQHQNTVTTLNRQIEETRKQLQNLREKLAANPNDVEVRRQYQELQSQLAAEEQRRASAERTVDSLRNEIVALNDFNQRLSVKLKNVFEYTRDIVKGLRGVEAEIDRFTVQSQTADIGEVTRSNIQKLKQKLDEANVSLAEFANQYQWAVEMRQEFEAMRQDLAQKELVIEELSKKYNTVYLLVGSTEELVQQGILEKSKEKTGIFRRRKVYNVNFNKLTPAICLAYDRRSRTITIPTSGEIKDVYPDIASDAFRIGSVRSDPGEKHLQIFNPQEFWKTNFVVITTN